MIRNIKGFTSIEVLIVLLISAALIVIWGVSKNSQIRAAYLREADVFFTDIINKERIAYDASTEATYYTVPKSSMTRLVGGIEVIDGRKYLYFRDFEVITADPVGFTAVVYGKDGTVAEGVAISMKYENGQRIYINN